MPACDHSTLSAQREDMSIFTLKCSNSVWWPHKIGKLEIQMIQHAYSEVLQNQYFASEIKRPMSCRQGKVQWINLGSLYCVYHSGIARLHWIMSSAAYRGIFGVACAARAMVLRTTAYPQIGMQAFSPAQRYARTDSQYDDFGELSHHAREARTTPGRRALNPRKQYIASQIKRYIVDEPMAVVVLRTPH